MKKVVSFFVGGAIVLGLLTGTPGGGARAATSNANVIFTPGTGPTAPVDPDDPTKPGEGEGTGGSLAVVSITDFDFGEMVVSVGAIHRPITVEKPNIQTVDLRGVGSGWHVTAQLGHFLDSRSNPSLPGAAITIAGGRPVSQYDLPAPVHETNVTLVAGSSQPTQVISADGGAGIGHWVMRWYPDGGGEPYIHLDIPVGRAEVGAHRATITWTLTDGP